MKTEVFLKLNSLVNLLFIFYLLALNYSQENSNLRRHFMLKYRLFVLAILLFPTLSFAQDTPKIDVFGGYSFMRLEGANLNGGIGSVTGNINKRFGLTAEFSYYGGKETVTVNNVSRRVSVTKIPYLFGPQFTFRNKSKVTPYVRALFGGVRERGIEPETAFGASFGGGIDYRINDKVSWRVQGDYLITRKGDTEHILRFSTGIVFHFGKR
jgi:opacity protein-like surface antigen